MTVNDLFVLLAAATAVRVFLPDIVAELRRVLRAGARVGVAELLSTQPARLAATAGLAAPAGTAGAAGLVVVPAREGMTMTFPEDSNTPYTFPTPSRELRSCCRTADL
ncbi:hypothetical protein [Streptomyces sp. NPDC055793]